MGARARGAWLLSVLFGVCACGEDGGTSGSSGGAGGTTNADASSGAGGGAGTAGGQGGAGGAGGSGGVSDGAAGAGTSELSLPVRAAFFYPWFPETWGNLSDPFTNYEPVAGYYDSSSPAVIETQLEQMRYAHIAAAISSWWGQGSKPDGRVKQLLDASAALAGADGGSMIRFALFIEAEGDAKPWGSLNPSVDQIRSDLEYIDASYAAHAAYWRLNGKPVVFTWGDSGDDCSSSERWVGANDAFEAATGKRFYIVLKLFSGFASCPVQPDSWHQYGPAVGYHEHVPYTAAVSPGFWLKGATQPVLARDPVRFSDDVAKMNAAAVSFKLVTTFNEWGEGTAVEPAKEWQSASANGVYLDILHDQPP